MYSSVPKLNQFESLRYLHAFLILIVLQSVSITAAAQSVVGISVGANTYIGELSPNGGSAQFTLGANYQHYFEERLFLRVGVQIGSIEGSYEPGDELSLIGGIQDRTEYFSASIATLDVSLNWEFIQLGFAHLYGGIGFGALSYTIVDQLERDLTERESTRLSGEEYATRVAHVPLNGGIILFPKKRISLVLEQTWLLTNTDYLDNIGYAGRPGSDTIIRRTFSVRYHF